MGVSEGTSNFGKVYFVLSHTWLDVSKILTKELAGRDDQQLCVTVFDRKPVGICSVTEQ